MSEVPPVCRATVVRKVRLSAHLVTVTLRPEDFTSTGVPDEYVRLMIAPEGAELAIPTYDENWVMRVPEGAVEPAARVYTISDHRVVDGVPEVDIDIAVHDHGVGADWVRRCVPGDEVGMMVPHGLYAAPADTAWQLLVADVTGLPALARILRDLRPGQRVEAVVVLTDDGDRIALPSPADVDVRWVVVEPAARPASSCDARSTGRRPTSTPAATGRSRPRSGTPATRRSRRRSARRPARPTSSWPRPTRVPTSTPSRRSTRRPASSRPCS
jgi:NADPH-dependent ferric siderophore reductase